MSRMHPRLSVGRRIFHMSLNWLFIGAMVGAVGGLRSGVLIDLVSGVIGGVIVLPVVGFFLGLIGGDAMGSVVGAVGGLLGCWLAMPTGGILLDPLKVEVVVVFGALIGATCFLYLQLVCWSYGILFRRVCGLVGGALVSSRASALTGYFGSTHERSTNATHFHSRPGRTRAQLTEHRNSDRA